MLQLGRYLQDKQLRAALAGSLTSLLTKVIAAAAGVALTVLVARRFGAALSGTWVLSNTILMIAGYATLCGLDYGTTRAVAVYREADRWGAVRAWMLTSFLLTSGVGTLVTLCVWAATPWFAAALGEGALFVDLTRTLCFAVIPYAILRLVAGAFRGVRKFALADTLESGVISFVLALTLLALNFQSLTAMGTAFVLIALGGALIGSAIWWAQFGSDDEREPLLPAEALNRSLPLAGAVLATLAGPWIVTLFLAKFASTADVGVYRVALQFALLLGFLLNAAETGLSPQIAALHSRNQLEALSNAAKRITLLLIVVGGFPALTLMLFATVALSILGPEFEQGASAMRILIAAQMFNLATGPVGSFLVMTGLGRLSFWNALAGGVIVLALSAVLIPSFGIVGAATAAGAGTVLRNIVATIIVWQRHGLFLPLGIIRR